MNDEKIFEEKLKNIFKNYEKIFLIQIGANDGIMADPLYNLLQSDSRIYAFLLEPQKEVFSTLKKNYNNIKKRITFLNVAIGKENGNVKLYKNIDPLGSSGHASLLLRQNEYACNFDENSYEIVESVTVANLLKDNKSEIDILVIDTEGYDIEIIKQFIEENAFPKVIFFERPYPLPGNDRLNNVETGNSVLEEIINKLEKLDYNVEVLSGNVLCIKNDLL